MRWLQSVKAASGVDPEMVIRHEKVQRISLSLFSHDLYSDATSTILDPMRKTTRDLVLMGPLERLSLARFQNPLPLSRASILSCHI